MPNLSKMTAGARMLYEQTVKKFPALMGRNPTAEDLAKIEFHANEFSKPVHEMNPAHAEELQRRLQATTPAKDMLVDASGRAYQPIHSVDQTKGLMTPEQAAGYNVDQFGSTPANFRAREGLYAPDVQAFESRDPFLTQAMTGRPPSGTRQKPFTTNIDDLAANRASLEAKGQYGDVADVAPGGYPTQSTTPSADYFANMAAKIEAAKLPTNIQSTLREALGRNPTEDEINAAIANLNVAGHDYTGKGAAIFGERPKTKQNLPLLSSFPSPMSDASDDDELRALRAARAARLGAAGLTVVRRGDVSIFWWLPSPPLRAHASFLHRPPSVKPRPRWWRHPRQPRSGAGTTATTTATRCGRTCRCRLVREGGERG